VRTTVTIDPENELLLKEEMARTGKSFKKVLNELLSLHLKKSKQVAFEVEPVVPASFPSEFEGMSYNQLADQLDDEDTLQELSK